jgi:phosphopantothenoylcysteine decarboxylase/phosphopantothenate--cysteine ligase
VGRLAEPAEILAAAEAAATGGGVAATGGGVAATGGGVAYTPHSLDGLRVLVTAGGTREPIDSVRYIGNRSSGRMGLALAEEAARRGADVTLLAANVTIPAPQGVETVTVETTGELETAVRERFPAADVLIMAAAPADFRPVAPAEGKISREAARSGAGGTEREAGGAAEREAGGAAEREPGGAAEREPGGAAERESAGGTEREADGLVVELEPTADIVAGVAAGRRPDQTVVGFAAEHGEGAVERGRGKLARKGLDAVVVNDISRTDIGFDSPENEVTIVLPEGEREVGRRPKSEVAAAILDEVERLRSRATEPPSVKPGPTTVKPEA